MNRSPRICIVTPEFPGPMRCGGLGTAVYWHARTLVAAGVPVDVLLTGDVEIGTPERWARRLRIELGITFVHAGSWVARERPDLARLTIGPRLPGVIRCQWVLAYLRANAYGVVYLQDYLGHGMAALQAREAGLDFQETHFSLTLHGPTRWALDGLEMFAPSAETYVIDHQEKTSVKLADRVFAPSQYLRDWVRDTWQVTRDIEILPYCFAPPAAGPKRVVHGPFRHLVFFGRLETRKGLELFLDALKSSPDLQRDIARVTFLGKNGQASGRTGRDVIESAFVDGAPFDWQILDDKDTFQAWRWLERQRDVLVVAPSLADNLPYAVIELFQRRVPFVTTEAGGIPEIVGANPAALCAPTSQALRGRLEEIVATQRLRVRYDTGYNTRRSNRANIVAHRETVARLRSTSRSSRSADANRAVGRVRAGAARVRPAVPLRRMPRPEVSVIVTHHNYGGYLPHALRSLAQQQCDFPFEVLVVDDASSRPEHRDAFLATRQAFASDPRFQFFAETTNRGAGGARNFAAALARGRYLVFFDADNEALPDLLAVYRHAIERSGCDVMTCYLAQVYQDDYAAPRPIDPDRTDFLYAPPGGGIEAGFLMNAFGDTCAIVRRSAFERVGGFSSDSAWYMRLPSGDWDWDLFAKMGLAGCRQGVVPRVLFRYRLSPGNQQSTNTRWRYRLRSIIRARYASPEGRAAVDWEWLLGLFETFRAAPASGAGAAGVGHYEYLAALPDEQLLAITGRAKGTSNDATIRHMRQQVMPLVARWARSRPRVFLYGAGLHTRVLLGVVPELAQFVTGVIDRSADGSFLGWPACRPDRFDPDACDVILYSSKEHERVMHAGMAHHPVDHLLLYHPQPPRALAIAR